MLKHYLQGAGISFEALKGFLGTQGKKGIYFRRTGEQRPNFDGNRGTKTILGNREHKKTAHFQFFGNMGTSQFISGEQGTRYPLGGPQFWYRDLLQG